MKHALTLLTTLLLALLAAKVTTAAATLPALDTYGGATTIKAEATGYFRLQQIHGRWFFVTPDGHAFLVNGINSAAAKPPCSKAASACR